MTLGRSSAGISSVTLLKNIKKGQKKTYGINCVKRSININMKKLWFYASVIIRY